MNRHDRRSPIVATALLVGLITVGLSTAASAEESNEEAAAESSESAEPSGGPGTVTAVLPGDSAMAGEIDLQQLQKSKYFDTLYRLLEQRGSQMKVYRVLQNAGISVKKDVHSLGFATTAARSDKIRSLEKGVVAVSGDFDSEKLTKALTENYAQLDEREVVGGRKVYTVERKGTTGDIGVVSDQLVVGAFGPKSYR
ncbi:MAG: hypothetical protein ABEL76_04990, partial [Bradymonadaceae bacterium]